VSAKVPASEVVPLPLVAPVLEMGDEVVVAAVVAAAALSAAYRVYR
jgi:hypothetical protein